MIRNILRTTAVYTVANGLVNGLPLLLLPLLTNYMSPSDFGLLSLYGVAVLFLTPLVGLNFQGAVSRRFFEVGSPELRSYVFTAIVATLFTCLISLGLFGVFYDAVASYLKLPGFWPFIAVLNSGTQCVINIVLALLQSAKETKKYSSFLLLLAFSSASLTLYLVISQGWSWEGYAFSQLGTSMVFSLLGVAIIYKNGWIGSTWSNHHLRDALAFGVPLVPHAIGGALIGFSDRLLLANILSTSVSGLFEVGSQVSAPIKLVAGSFNQAWFPWLYEKLQENSRSASNLIVRYCYLWGLALILLALLYWLIAIPLMSIFVPVEYEQASQFVFWLCLGNAFYGMYFLVANFLFFAKRTGYLAMVTFFTGVLNLGLSYFLIILNGAKGAAQATCIAFFISFIATWALSQRVQPVPWRYGLRFLFYDIRAVFSLAFQKITTKRKSAGSK